jgi:exosortase
MVWGALLIASLPLFAYYLYTLYREDRTHYQFVPLALLSVVVLFKSRWDRILRRPSGWFAWLLITLGVIGIASASYVFSPLMGAIAFVAFGAALLWSSFDGDGKRLIGLALPLAMVVHLPLGLDHLLIVKLQQVTTKITAVLLDRLSVPHMTTGNVIGLVNRELFVAEACSGIQSVFTLLFIASFLVAYRKYPLWFAPPLWLAALVMAVLGNSLRVAIVALASVWMEKDWTAGVSHELVGYASLGVATLLLLAFDQFLQAMFHPIRSVGRFNPAASKNALVKAWDKWVAWLDPSVAMSQKLAPAYASVGSGDSSRGADSRGDVARGMNAVAAPIGEVASPQAVSGSVKILLTSGIAIAALATAWLSYRMVNDVRAHMVAVTLSAAEQPLFNPPEQTISGMLGNLPVQKYELVRDAATSKVGLPADIWTVGNERVSGQFLLSQPYPEWHDLCICYQVRDWELVDSDILRAAPGQEPAPNAPSGIGFARFRKDGERNGYLWVSAITYDGKPVEPPPPMASATPLARRLGEYVEPVVTGNLMMVQLWVETSGRLTADELLNLRVAFDEGRQRITDVVQQSSPNKATSSTPTEEASE